MGHEACAEVKIQEQSRGSGKDVLGVSSPSDSSVSHGNLYMHSVHLDYKIKWQ